MKNRHNVDAFFLPENAFRAGVKEKVMLDGVTLKELSSELGAPVHVGSANGGEFCRQLKAFFCFGEKRSPPDSKRI